MKWKYLRETRTKYFDDSINTALEDYLNYIFPGYDFIYNQTVPKDIIIQRNSKCSIRRYRPDARCEKLNLIVEYDGLDHYCNQSIVLSDIERDEWFRKLNYKIVRIPYWIQLSSEMIHYFFNIDIKEPMCELCSSFRDNNRKDNGLSTSVGSMSEAGRYRFLNTVTDYPLSEQLKVYNDLKDCININCNYGNIPEDYILPKYIYQKWINITPELVRLSNEYK